MSNRGALLATLILVGWSLPAIAGDQWQVFHYLERGFAALFPLAPKTITHPAKDSDPPFYEFRAEPDADHAYEVFVIEFSPGKGPSLDAAAYSQLISHYADASGSKVRGQQPTTIAGYPGMEAIIDGKSADLHHLLDITFVGDRIYLIVSAGPKGHETSADALRFRDSFRLTSP